MCKTHLADGLAPLHTLLGVQGSNTDPLVEGGRNAERPSHRDGLHSRTKWDNRLGFIFVRCAPRWSLF